MEGFINVRFTVEGNVGSGKSTLIEGLKDFMGLETVLEPVEIYTNFHRYNLLREQQDARKLLACQVAIANTLFMRGHGCKASNQLVERGNESFRMFIEFFRDKYTDLKDKVLLDQMKTLDACRLVAKKDIVIYLRTSHETAIKRVGRRARSGDESIDPEFLRKLSDLHDKQLLRKPEVIVVEADQGAAAVQERVIKIIKESMTIKLISMIMLWTTTS